MTSPTAVAASGSERRRERGEQACVRDGFAGDHVLGQRSRCTPLNTREAQEDAGAEFHSVRLTACA